MPVWACIGNIGKGKTMLMTMLGYITYCDGSNLFANYKLIGMKYEPIISFKKMKESIDAFNPTTILADELWISADARKSQEADTQTSENAIMQSRKWGKIGNEPLVIYSTQDFIQTAKRIRHVTEKCYTTNIIRDPNTNYPLALKVYWTTDVKDYNMFFPYNQFFILPTFFGSVMIPEMYDTTEQIESFDSGNTEHREEVIAKYTGWTDSKAKLKAVLIFNEGIPKTDAGLLADYIKS